jgi:hypothetical protein
MTLEMRSKMQKFLSHPAVRFLMAAIPGGAEEDALNQSLSEEMTARAGAEDGR